jgi:transposase
MVPETLGDGIMAGEMELFSVALGLVAPWRVERVELDPEAGELHLYLEAAAQAAWRCRECDQVCPLYDHSEERVWRHLNFFQYQALLHARVPRVRCQGCGVHTVAVPWARPGCGFTLLFEAFTLTLAQQMPVHAVGRIVGEHDTRLWRVLEHYVATARARQDMSQVRQVGVDETASARGQEYVTVVADLDAERVLFVTEGKSAEALHAFKTDLEAHQGQATQLETVCSDLGPAYIRGGHQEFPQALPVFDHFHVLQLVNDALDQVRRQEVPAQPVLKDTRYLWLKNPENLTAPQQAQLDHLCTLDLATGRAYQQKLQLRQLWDCPDRARATPFLKRWCQDVLKSDPARPVRQAVRTLQAHAAGILNYFEALVTNGLLEGLNSLIQAAKTKARGFRSSHYFKTIIYLLTGKLDFQLPLTHTR